MVRDGLLKVAEEMPKYFGVEDKHLEKTAALNEEIRDNKYTDRDLLKIAYVNVLTALDMLKTYRNTTEDLQDMMEKNAEYAKKMYEETGYLTKVAEYLAKNLKPYELKDVANAIDIMEKTAAEYMEKEGYTGERGRLHAHIELFGTPEELIKEAAYDMLVVGKNIKY